MTARVVFYVMHLQGIGHVARASRISEQLVRDGFAVTLVLGGMPLDAFRPEGVDIVQLPPLRMAPDSYRDLRTADDRPVDDDYKAARYNLLLETLRGNQPDFVMIEAYPFDRPQMHFELVPFLQAANDSAPRPIIVSSIRDILQRKDKPERDATALQLLQTYFDAVLVHGDPGLAKLNDTFPHANAIADMVHYTGMIAPAGISPLVEPSYDVFVTAGGGSTGKAMLPAAIAAKPMTALADDRWVVTYGHNIPFETIADVRAAGADANVDVLPFLPDLGQHLLTAKLSISQCGYNTAVDLLCAGCPAVLCPYSGARQNEQLRRAELMAERELAVLLREEDLSPEAMAAAIDKAVSGRPRHVDIDLGGAERTGGILRDLLAVR